MATAAPPPTLECKEYETGGAANLTYVNSGETYFAMADGAVIHENEGESRRRVSPACRPGYSKAAAGKNIDGVRRRAMVRGCRDC
jgi:hypothetical protein